MFVAHCDNFGRDVLIWTSNVHSIDNSEHCIVLRYLCVCGQMAEMLTGVRSPVRVNVHLGEVAWAEL